MTTPTVSIVIPARNAANTIRRAVDSVEAQVADCLKQIVLIDDGSTDDTLASIEDLISKIEVIRLEGRGVSVARNAGLSRCSGQYIAFLDADDEWYPNKLNQQLSFLNGNESYVLCGSVADCYDDTRRFVRRSSRAFAGDALAQLIKGNFIVTSSVVVRASVIVNDNLRFNEMLSFAEDWALWIRLAARGNVKIFGQSGLRYSVHPPKKYGVEEATKSLELMVEMLLHDNCVRTSVGTNLYKLRAIPKLHRVSFARQAVGPMAAFLQGGGLALQEPRLARAILKRVFRA